MSKIVKDISILRKKSENTTSVDEARSLISDLENILEKTDNGIGLAAIQIGCPKKVGVIKDGNGKYFHLINPEIIEKSEEFVYFNEGCLSFPNVFKNTKRYKQITVKHQKIADGKFEDEIFVSYYSLEDEPGNNGLMAIAVQHEIDHFSGLLIVDSEVKNEPIIRKNDKIGRNDPCLCKSGKKFKKCCGK